jgi:hypothetical protein
MVELESIDVLNSSPAEGVESANEANLAIS